MSLSVLRKILYCASLLAVFAFHAPAFAATTNSTSVKSNSANSQTDADADIDVMDEVRKCSETVDRIERLICFDDLSKKLGFVTPDKAEREEEVLQKYGFWVVTKKRTAAGEEIIYLKNDAIEYVFLESGLRRKPTFVIQCKHGETEAYLDWKSRLSPNFFSGYKKLPISWRMDSGEMIQESWDLSTDRNAVFAPDAVEFIKRMRKHDKLFFRITPAEDSTHTVVHDISGLDKALKILVDQCYN